MVQDIATIWAIVGAIVWLALLNAGFIDHACARLRYPAATMAMLTLGIIAGWPIVAGYWLDGAVRHWRAGR
jgi:hypothetical protein